MRMAKVRVPDIGESMDSKDATVTRLMVEQGDTIGLAQPVVTVESDRGSMEIPSSHAGVVKEVHVRVGDRLVKDMLLLTVEQAGDTPHDAPTAAAPVWKYARELGVDLSMVPGSGAANFTTYNDMKQRAGLVGSTGVAQLLMLLRQKNPALKLHLIGHRFGGRLITAAANKLPPGTPAVTLSLLQAAYSHNGLARNFDGRNHDGAFRTLLSEQHASGPIVITHTRNDRAVGLAYPLASRISRDVASSLGDGDDPYGGMGRNGAQRTPEVDFSFGTLLPPGGQYGFAQGKIYNLNADDVIRDHGDVSGPQVAYAILHAVGSV